MRTKGINEIGLQAVGQNSEDGTPMISRRTLIKVGWTAPVVAVALTPASVFATCSEGYNPVGCTRSPGFYSQLQNWTKDNLQDFQSVTVAGSPLNKEQILYILNTESSKDNTPYKLFRQLVASKIGTDFNQTTTDWHVAGDPSKTIVDVIKDTDALLSNYKYLTIDKDGNVITDGVDINNSLSKEDIEKWNTYSGYLSDYITQYECGG